MSTGGFDDSESNFSYGSASGAAQTGGSAGGGGGGGHGQQKRRASIKALTRPSLDVLGEVADDDDNEDESPGSLPPLPRSRHSRGPSGGSRGTIGGMLSVVASGNRSGASTGGGSGSDASGAGRVAKGFRSTILGSRMMASRTAPQSVSGSGGGGGAPIDPIRQLDAAAQSGEGWESVAAAAALVASEADATKTSSRHMHRYGVGDRVLVSLTVMNATLGGAISSADLPFSPEEEEDGGESAIRERIEELKESSTLVPVNKYGFPPSGAPVGSSPDYHRGPYGYVLATVARVHFEEDAQYYTVTRADTNTDQRADAEWMEPLTSDSAYDAALRAAQTTKKSTEAERNGLDGSGGMRGLEWFRVRIWNKMVGSYRAARVRVKVQTAKFLYGSPPYGFHCQFSGVNFLVCCSFIYMFIDNVRLAFFSASSDWIVMIITTVVWSILVIELLFEVLVRPEGYSALIASEKAYAPSTARYINGFHLFFEVVALAFFVPDFRCFASKDCGAAYNFSVVKASLNSVLGPTAVDAFYGHFYFITLRLRVFSLVRHWKKMWITHTFDEPAETKSGGYVKGYFVPYKRHVFESLRASTIVAKKHDNQTSTRSMDEVIGYDREAEEEQANKESRRQAKMADRRLSKAATIGTALMVVNSHRAMILIVAIVGILPLIYCALDNGGTNGASRNSVKVLQENNILIQNENEMSCLYLETTVSAWMASLVNANVNTAAYQSSDRIDTALLWAQLLPARCGMREDGVITICPDGLETEYCDVWSAMPADEISASYFAETLNLRSGVIATHSFSQTIDIDGIETVFNATAMFNEGHTVAYANFASFLLQFLMLFLIVLGLTVLRGDAGHLVIDPLRRMLKIVLRYATNPLAQTETKRKKKSRSMYDDDITIDSDSDVEYSEKNELGNYETEQLISAIGKITDLLRKCWGVAGAGIISTNLARTQDGKTVVFNPTVAGKRVYALFGFAGINEFGHLLRNLDQDVMVLINDIAKIVHEEVYRWGLGDSGQCNKNLGAAFLMVYRIGDFKEVEEKKARATEVIFTSSEEKSKKTSQAVKRRGRVARKKRASKGLDTLQLASLPGIQAFTDRALLGMLKSFAGIYRDRSLQKWTKDFRLGAGVDAFSLGLIFGMDAGWGVEGAVGSEYKIDATYLSPHVNMASRMMSACKQYDAKILLSQAVEKLLSSQARSKLRHLDTVTVKGSTLKQQIFTYDCRNVGVDFFLFERSPAQADADSVAYTPNIWNTDQDLKAMRQHISPDFERAFNEGRNAYLAGKWDHAISRLEIADRCMIETALDEGFLEYEALGFADQLRRPATPQDEEELIRLRAELGDGACRSILTYMKNEGGIAPDSWRGVRPLTSK